MPWNLENADLAGGMHEDTVLYADPDLRRREATPRLLPTRGG